MEPLQCLIRPLLENLPAVQAPFLQSRFPKRPNRKHVFSTRTALRSMTKCQRSHSWKNIIRPRGLLMFYWFSATLLGTIVLLPRTNTWAMAMCQGTIPEKIQPVSKPSWKFRFLIHSYRNHCFTIKGQKLSHGNVSSDHFWKICQRCKHPSCNFDFLSTRHGHHFLVFCPRLWRKHLSPRPLQKKTAPAPKLVWKC